MTCLADVDSKDGDSASLKIKAVSKLEYSRIESDRSLAWAGYYSMSCQISLEEIVLEASGGIKYTSAIKHLTLLLAFWCTHKTPIVFFMTSPNLYQFVGSALLSLAEKAVAF